MIFSYNWLQSFFPAKGGQGQKFPQPEKLAELLTLHSFEAKVSKSVKLPSGASDILLNIDILPNRAHDCFCHLGVAKEISALLNMPLKKPIVFKKDTLKQKTEDFLKLKVQEPDLCRRYIAKIMFDVKVGPSPSWLKERLIAVGQRPINNIVDASNYVMFEMGQPLHALDIDKMEGEEIIVRRAKNGEKITTLDNKKFTLDNGILVIADSKDPLAIAGVKGGKKAEIDAKTKKIVIEAANFEPVNIRLTSQKLGLKTGASFGFENKITPNLASSAMERVTALIQEMAGGKIVAEPIDFYPKKVPPSRILFKLDDVSKLIGADISEKEIISILSRLGFEIKKAKNALTAVCPIERLDLTQKEDVIEEIARIHSYEKIPSQPPEGFLVPPARNESYFYENVIRDILVGAGFSEVYNYSFAATGEIEIQNPIAGDKKYLRANLLDGLKDNARRNLKYFNEVKIFEIGKIFQKSKEGIKEKNTLACTLAYKNSKTSAEYFYEMKGVIEALLSALAISDFWFDDSPEIKAVESETPLKLAEIKIGNESVGFVDKNAFEIDLEKLARLATEEIEYRPVSKYPAVMRDIAVLVPTETKVISVLDVIENEAGGLLIDTDLFDIYEGEELGENKKNLAFHLIFQSEEKTLSDKEVNALMNKIIKALDGNPDWEVRKN